MSSARHLADIYGLLTDARSLRIVREWPHGVHESSRRRNHLRISAKNKGPVPYLPDSQTATDARRDAPVVSAGAAYWTMERALGRSYTKQQNESKLPISPNTNDASSWNADRRDDSVHGSLCAGCMYELRAYRVLQCTRAGRSESAEYSRSGGAPWLTQANQLASLLRGPR